ncbi:MAG: transposase family protein, partial [Planctomycetes bacterium]|nr:transposase family protein [Planctomycetota bacterium]
MLPKPSAKIQDHFAELTDPRVRKVTYPLINVVVISVCAVICGADDFVAIAEWGRKKHQWLARFLDLEKGIPSH